MTTINHSSTPESRRAVQIVAAAILTTLIAVGAGVALLAFDPADGSTSEGVLGITAAVSGLATAALVIAAFVYAQAKGLWSRVPTGARAVLWVLIAIGVARTAWNLVSQVL